MSSCCFKLVRCTSMHSLSIFWACAFMVSAMLLTSVSAPLSKSPILISAHTLDGKQKNKKWTENCPLRESKQLSDYGGMFARLAPGALLLY